MPEHSQRHRQDWPQQPHVITNVKAAFSVTVAALCKSLDELGQAADPLPQILI
jgi:hypothetical protein